MQARRRFHDTDESVALIANGHNASHQQQQPPAHLLYQQQQPSLPPSSSASSSSCGTVLVDVDDSNQKYAPHPAAASAAAAAVGSSKWSALTAGRGFSAAVSGLLSSRQLTQAVYAPLQQQLSQAVASSVAPVRYLLDSAQLQPNPSSSSASSSPRRYTSVITGNLAGKQATVANNDPDTEDTEEPEFELEVMASRDRTAEFGQAIRQLQSRNVVRAVNVRDARKAAQLQSYAEFMQIAKHVGKNIASTYAKLEKLTLLAKRKSLFDDRPDEIKELTYIIKGDLNSLNQQIARLQEVSKSQRRDAGNGRHLLSHSSNMVLALQAKLANMSTDFKQILEVRTENLKHQKTRRDQFSSGPVATNLPPSSQRGDAASTSSLLLSEQNRSRNYQPQQQHVINFDDDNASAPLLQPSGSGLQMQQQQQQQLAVYDESDNYVQQRAETMQNIESTIVELGGIFQQLAHMVKEQEEMVERIDSNVQDAELNVEAAHGQILKYFQSVTNNHWLMVKIFGVLIAFFIFFVVFMA